MISIGSLNHRIVIKKWQDVPMGAFDVEQTYDEGVQVWASVEPVGSQVYWNTQQIGEQVTHRFKIRRVQGIIDERTITAQHIVQCDGYRYSIKRVNDFKSARRFVIIEAKEEGPI